MWKNPYEPGTREYVTAHRDHWYPDVPIIDELPDGWHIKHGGTTAPIGAKWCATGSLFYKTNGCKKYEHALLFVGV